MTDGDLLLQAIIADPADDTARLVYADWLQEQGDEARAEFVRVQVEEARTRTRTPRGYELYEATASSWVPFPLTGPETCGFSTRRGFIDTVQCRAEWWVTRGDTISGLHPVRGVKLLTRPKLLYPAGGKRVALAGDPNRTMFRRDDITQARNSLTTSRMLTDLEIVLWLRWKKAVAFELPPERNRADAFFPTQLPRPWAPGEGIAEGIARPDTE